MSRDAASAALVGAVAFAVYLRTLAPGVVATLDTPMFQFIGRVLGVAHNPGYPLYVLLTHPFSYLPVGSLAYRINLFSAICASIAVALVFLAARQLGCRRSLSAAAALALAFGQTFWSQAVIAEVYALNAALVAGVLLSMLRWRRGGRPGHFYLAVALLGVGLGNHTTIVGFAPAIAACVFVADRRFATRRRTLGIAACLVGAGLLQYAFIILRTRQGAYVESPASTVAELLSVMRGAQFSRSLFAFDLRQVFLDRVPFVAEHVLRADMTLPVLLLSAVGLVLLLRSRLADGILLTLGAAGILAFVLNYKARDLPVFAIPAVLVLLIAAAFAAESLTAAVSGRVPRAGAVVAVVALIVPVLLVSRNFAANDLSRNSIPATYFKGLFAGFSSKGVIVREDFLTDRMVAYHLLGEKVAGARRIVQVRQNPARLRDFIADAYSVLAFQTGTSRLRYQGMEVAFTQPHFVEGSLAAYLSSLRDGSVVCIAVPGAHTAGFASSEGAQLRTIGGPSVIAGSAGSNLIIAGVRGARSGALERHGSRALRLDVASGAPIGTTGWTAPSGFSIESDGVEAVVRFGGRETVRTTEGAAVAVWNRDGGLEQAFVLQSVDRFRVPVPSWRLTARAVRGMARSVRIGGTWTDLTGIAASGSMMLRVPPGATLTADVRADRPLSPRVVEPRSGPVTIVITPRDDGYRIEASTPGAAASPAAAEVAFGGIPGRVLARRGEATSGQETTAFAIPLHGLLRTPDRSSEILSMGRDDQARLVGAGWSAVDGDAFGPFRWIADGAAHLLLPVGGRNSRRIAVEAYSSGHDGSTVPHISLEVNGTRLAVQPIASGWHRYVWGLLPGVLPGGLNLTVIRVDPPGSRVAVASVAIAHGVN